MGAFLGLLLLLNGDLFVAEATAEATYTIQLSREALAGYVDDIGLFKRNMPGVVAVTDLGGNRYLYVTEKELPLAQTMRTEFEIEKVSDGESTTIYRSVDEAALNYMFTRVMITADDSLSSRMHIEIRLRLSRRDASEVHWMAPLMGEEFISYQMTKDLQDMLETFIERSTEDLYNRVGRRAAVAE